MTPEKFGIGLLLLGGLALTTPLTSAQTPARSIEGLWGGDHLQLVIDSSGGRLEMDCASGTLIGLVTLAENGTFVALGTFEPHQPGPQRVDQGTRTQAARYSGEVKGGVMTLEILPAGALSAQAFELRQGARVKLIRCL